LITIAIYFYEMGARWWVPTNLWLRALAKSCLSVSVGSILLFYASFFKFLYNKILKGLIAINAVVFTALLFANSHDDTALMSTFSLSLLPIFAGIFVGLFILIRSAIHKNLDSIPILIGLAVGMGFGVHDIVYQVAGGSPFAWLQGFTFFALNVSVFIALALRDSRMEKDLAKSIRTTEQQKEALSRFVSGIEKAMPALAQVSESLERSVSGVAEAIGQAADSAASIDAALGKQNALIADSAQAVEGLLASIESIGVELEKQARDLSANAESIAVVAASIDKVNEGASQASGITERFKTLSEQGEKQIERLSGSMRAVGEVIGEVRAITGAVNDFAERTNMLAMNASIEAAHAGAMGKGFGVIAHEIKKLAAASAERAGRIGEIASQVGDQTERAMTFVEGMSASLAAIANEAGEAAAAIKAVGAQAQRQMESSVEIDSTITRLSQASEGIRGETRRQTDLSVRVRERVGALKHEGEKTGAAAAEIRAKTDRLLGEMRALKELSDKTREVIRDFEDLTRER
jgi:methyl-accepting chemotaxis protein